MVNKVYQYAFTIDVSVIYLRRRALFHLKL